MNLNTVFDEMGDALRQSIPNLRVYDHAPDEVKPPAAMIVYPDTIDYDGTYAAGMDTVTVPVVVVINMVSKRGTRQQLAEYAGRGPRSIKAALENFADYTVADFVHVAEAEFDVVAIGGVEYMAGSFLTTIVGAGTEE